VKVNAETADRIIRRAMTVMGYSTSEHMRRSFDWCWERDHTDHPTRLTQRQLEKRAAETVCHMRAIPVSLRPAVARLVLKQIRQGDNA